MAFGASRSIALSQAVTYFHDEVVAHWETAEHYGPGIVQRLVEIGLAQGTSIVNVNFRAFRRPEGVTGVEVTRQGLGDLAHAEHGKSGPTCGVATTIGPASAQARPGLAED